MGVSTQCVLIRLGGTFFPTKSANVWVFPAPANPKITDFLRIIFTNLTTNLTCNLFSLDSKCYFLVVLVNLVVALHRSLPLHRSHPQEHQS